MHFFAQFESHPEAILEVASITITTWTSTLNTVRSFVHSTYGPYFIISGSFRDHRTSQNVRKHQEIASRSQKKKSRKYQKSLNITKIFSSKVSKSRCCWHPLRAGLRAGIIRSQEGLLGKCPPFPSHDPKPGNLEPKMAKHGWNLGIWWNICDSEKWRFCKDVWTWSFQVSAKFADLQLDPDCCPEGLPDLHFSANPSAIWIPSLSKINFRFKLRVLGCWGETLTLHRDSDMNRLQRISTGIQSG